MCNSCQTPLCTHANHLGSASWITDKAGRPVQYIHYALYGELIDNQTPFGYDERFKFTGKERDKEIDYEFSWARFHGSISRIQTVTIISEDKWFVDLLG